jgi:hypothetical protein
MAEKIPSWSPADERELQRLQERKEARARMLSQRVEDVADKIHCHNISATEIAQGLIQEANEITRVVRPFLKGPFTAMIFLAGTILNPEGKFDRIQVKEWDHKGIIDALDADGWVMREFLTNELTEEMDDQGNRLYFFETLRFDCNVATIRCNVTDGYLTIVRISEGEGEY